MASDSEKLKDLSQTSIQALNDYDELLVKYNALLEEHERTKSQLDQLESVVEPMYDEFGEIQTKLQYEQSLRSVAENYAMKVVKDNKKIKRQSAMLLSQMSASPLKAVNIDIDVEEPSNDQDELVQKLNGTISELEDELASHKTELRKVTDDNGMLTVQCDTLLAEREEYRMKCEELEKNYNSQHRDFRQLKRASNLAWTDYSTLEERYNKEKALRLKAETYAKELQRKRDSAIDLKRASLHQQENGEVNGEVTGTEEVKKMIAENAKLHAELSEQDIKYREEIEELNQKLEDSSSHMTIETLEEKVSVLSEDLDKVQTELDTKNHENKHLNETVTKLQKELKEFMAIPLPPPPPPPPGPKGGISKLIISKKKKAEKKLEKVGVVKNDAMQGAIQEMMARIQGGKSGLRSVNMKERSSSEEEEEEPVSYPKKNPVPVPRMRKNINADDADPEDMHPKDSDKEEGGAMKEMHNYLVQMKQTKAAQQRAAPKTNIDPELSKAFARRRPMLGDIKEQSASMEEHPEDSELAMRLNQRLNKQSPVDNAPVPTPRKRAPPPVASKPEPTDELTARLSARRKQSESQNGDDEQQ